MSFIYYTYLILYAKYKGTFIKLRNYLIEKFPSKKIFLKKIVKDNTKTIINFKKIRRVV